MPQSDLSFNKLRDSIRQALKTWYEAGSEASPFSDLRLFQQNQWPNGASPRQATNQILLEALTELALTHQEGADLLRKRFLDGLAMHAVAGRFNIGEATAYRRQEKALDRLTHILHEKEICLRSVYQTELEKRLDLPPTVRLFGIEQPLHRLRSRLLAPEPSWLLSIEGIGGIGKTALANSLIRQMALIDRFPAVAWVSAKQHEFLPDFERAQLATPALSHDALIDQLLDQLSPGVSFTQPPSQKRAILSQHLKQMPHLIVIDNLETVADYQTLLPLLRELANPTKFIITSRHSLQAQPDVFCCTLNELNQADALTFIRHEATTRGLPLLAQASETDLRRIYEVVGGNPLAIKLVVGQLSVLPLPIVLANLKQARGKNAEAFYSFIYWQVWQLLTPISRQALLVMPLAHNPTLEQLLALSRLDLAEISEALDQLVGLSLIQAGGNLETRRYTIHRLTETFLLTEAIEWPNSP
ncbi:MAG: hypothetical protein H6631_09945 [Anaerolineaceae bacterium]|nr:hypothetical protein [Anaerolineaceae bacterium]MCB9098485.1 hypothetical protein [Anaerolineales bacterium]